MDLPSEIKNYIENELNSESIRNIKEDAQDISQNYRKNERKGNSLILKKSEAIAYAIARMPATYGAISNAIEKTMEIYNPKINSVADIGAGTGSACIAVNEIMDVDEIDCFEREEVMLEVGREICSNYSPIKDKVSWNKLDIVNDTIDNKYDMVVSAYMINELKENQISDVIDKIWKMTNDIVIIIEPGTVQGYNNIMKVKEKIIELGGNIISPCMSKKCGLSKDDWCNFYCRVQRTKMHKNLKVGEASFEDEKFMYIAVTKKQINIDNKSRIIRHPLIYNGFIKLKVCNNEGVQEIRVTKKEKERFKIAKKAKHGDLV